MIEFFKELLFSKEAFKGWASAVLVGFGLAVATDEFKSVIAPQYGPWIAMSGVFLRSVMNARANTNGGKK